MDTDKTYIEGMINSVLVTVRDLLTVEQLRKDYINLVGEEIPYRKFGCSSLYSFLETIPSTVTLIRKGNLYYVKPVPLNKTAHIAKLVQGQKASKKPAAIRNPTRNPSSHWVPPSANQRAYGSYRHTNSSYGLYTHPNSSYGSYKHPNSSYGSYRHPNSSSPYRGGPKVSQPRNAPIRQPLLSRPNEGFKSPSQPVTEGFKSPSQPVTEGFKSPSQPVTVKPSSNTNISKSVIQPAKQDITPICSVVLPPSSPIYKSDKEKLIAEAELHKISISKFITIKAGKSKPYWISKVVVNNISYSTYPAEIKSSAEAEEAASELAIMGLGLEKISLNNKTPLTVDFRVACRRVIDIVSLPENHRGIWLNALMDGYIKKHNEKLQDNFREKYTSENLNEIEFFSPDMEHWIVCKAVKENNFIIKGELLEKRDMNERLKGRVRGMKDEIITEGKVVKFENTQELLKNPKIVEEFDGVWPDLHLPKEKHWNIYVTFIKNCSSICIRLIGKEYNEAFENLMTNMELHYVEKRNQISVDIVVEGEFYAYSTDTQWFRVYVEKIQGNTALVNFVDHGDDENVPLSKLYKLKREFQQLAIQSIPCTLAGLDSGFEHERVLNELQSLALGKSLVAEVLAENPDISIVLFDTSTESDININDRLLNILPETFKAPVLPAVGGVCEAYVTHAEINGDVFITLYSQTYSTLESILDNIEGNPKKETSPIHGIIDVNKMYLCKYSRDGDWKRTAPLSANLDTNEALKCRLSNVPSSKDMEWTETTVKRLLQLLPESNEPLLLKVQKDGNGDDSPEVELFKRLQPQNELVSINATLAHDSALFRKTESSSDKHSRLHSLRKSGNDFLLPRSEIPDLFQYFDVHVCYAASPQNFGVQNHQYKAKFVQLMEDIQSHYNKTENLVKLPFINSEQLFVAQYTNHMWYRVKINHCAGQMVSALKVDYGDIFCTANDKIQPLLPQFRNLPPQGYRASLAGITPINGDWTPEDCLRFRELVQGKDLVSVVIKVETKENDLPKLELKLIDTNGENDIHLDLLFIKEERALVTADM